MQRITLWLEKNYSKKDHLTLEMASETRIGLVNFSWNELARDIGLTRAPPSTMDEFT